ncbi:translocation/assembly module TamB domain-containing protein [Thioalkalivibrio sp. ALJ24]|uniref:translocation/assembly module TamB domain-containing protein n=1 Tax=Thioalkalivibrio sp. ALJ24 TaxID=545276 RepID=UPI000378D2AC|nr:translocation/assembly module TamB domain-containing protein [Thioalkalivibrio sp. ALJ24]
MKRWLRIGVRGLGALLVLLVGLVAALVTLLATESGTRWLAEQGERHAPVDLAITEVEGTLFRGLSMRGLTLELPEGPNIAVDEARVALDIAGLLALDVRVAELGARGLRVDLPDAPEEVPEPEEEEDPPAFELPERIAIPLLGVHLDRLWLADLRVTRTGEDLFALTHLEARASARDTQLHLHHLDVELPDPELRLNLHARLQADGDFPVEAGGRWQLGLPEAAGGWLEREDVAGMLDLEGDLRRSLRLNHRVEAGPSMETRVTLHDPFDAPALELEHAWEAFALALQPDTRLALDAGRLQADATPDDWDLALTAGARLDPWPALDLQLAAQGDLESARVETLDLRSAAGNLAVSGEAGFADELTWDLGLDLDDLDLAALETALDDMPELDAGIRRLSATSRGRLPPGAENPLAALEAAVTLTELEGHFEDQPLTGELDLQLAEGRARFEQGQFRLGDARLSLQGHLDGLQAAADDPETRWPFALDLDLEGVDVAQFRPDADARLDRLRLALTGALAPAEADFDAGLALTALEASAQGVGVRGDGRVELDARRARIRELNLRSDPGAHLGLSGEVGYGAGLDWDLDLRARELDPGLAAPDFPGRLALDLHTAGRLDPQAGPTVEARIRRLDGELREQPVSGSGELRLEDEILDIRELVLELGDNRARIAGRVADTLDLDLALQAPGLDALMPGLGGELELDARLHGDRDAPRITARGHGTQLRFEDFVLERLELEADTGLAETAPAEIDLSLHGVASAGQTLIEHLELSADGTAGEHRARLDLEAAEFGQLELAVDGGLDTEALHWRGRIQQLALDQPLAGRWSLAGPVAVEGGPESARLERLCLQRDGGEICAEGRLDPSGEASFAARLGAIDLAWLEPLLTPELALQGTVDAEADGRLDAEGRVDADLAVTPSDGVLQVRDGDDLLQEVPWRDTRLTARVRDRDVDAELRMDFLDDGMARADIALREEDGVTGIQGDLEARLEDLAWLAATSPEIENLRGAFELALELDGPLEDPLVEGGLRFIDGGVTIPEAGIDVAVPELRADVLSASEMTITGALESGEGRIDLDGRADLGEDGPQVLVRIDGEDFLAVNRADAEALIEPALRIRFRPDEGLAIRGGIGVPWARLRPPDLPPGAVRVSGDQVIVGEEEERPAALPIDIRVRLHLGDDVRFDGFGLSARFAGEVDVEQVTGRPTQMFGEIRIPEGEYTSYGQDLQIDRGILLFQGPPEAPDLDLRAVRRVPDHNVTVGLEIGGTPEALRSRIFSEPPMDETEALSYLLTGRPLSGASESDGNMLAAAAAGWGLEQGAMITQRIGTELGLDEVELDTDAGLDQSALTLGLYLSPRLLLRYTVGLFDNTSRVLLRYELTRSLSVETSSGSEGQTIDLIYRHER